MTSRRTVAWPTITITLTAAGVRPALGEVVGDRPRRRAVGADDEGGDPLGDLGLGRRIARAAPLVEWLWMSMNPGASTRPPRVDELVPRTGLHVADRGDPAVVDADGRPPRRAAGAVDDARAGDDECRRVGALALAMTGEHGRKRHGDKHGYSRGHIRNGNRSRADCYNHCSRPIYP